MPADLITALLGHKNDYLSPVNEGLKPFVGAAFPAFPAFPFLSYVSTEQMPGLLYAFYLTIGLSRNHFLQCLQLSLSQGQTVFLQFLLFSQSILLHQ